MTISYEEIEDVCSADQPVASVAELRPLLHGMRGTVALQNIKYTSTMVIALCVLKLIIYNLYVCACMCVHARMHAR